MADTIRKDHPDTPLRLALTIPGNLYVEKAPDQINAANALDSFQVNALGPMLLMKHLYQFLPKRTAPPFEASHSPSSSTTQDALTLPSHSIYAMMAARVGSISDNSSGGWWSYRASKASVYQIAKTLDLHLRGRSAERALAVAMHPGTVRTDFTREFQDGRGMIEPEESARRLLDVLVNMEAGPEGGRGRCWDWKGEEVRP